MKVLPSNFYNRDPLLVAPEILGKILVRKLDDQVISGRIVEVEAYLAFNDAASHSFVGKTKRNASVFKAAGHAYIYSIHRQHCLDVVTEGIDIPSSLLIRALEPLEGIELMKKFRTKTELKDLTTGPGKLCQALSITKELDGINMADSNSQLFIIDDGFIQKGVATSKRIGVTKAKEDNYRYYIKDSIYISRK